MLYGSQSRFLWTDDEGVVHTILQGEGGEQGCPLMPALYALAQHDALVEADGNLLPNERILSFLDDLYVVTSRARASEAFREVAASVEYHAGVKSNLGKLHAWSKGGGEAPPEIAALGPDVWTADLPEEQNGIVILGTPLGTRAFVEAHAEKRLADERRLLEQIGKLQDVQCAWVLLSQSAVPRANHTIRILPPSLSQTYASQHDTAVWEAFCKMLDAQHHTADELAEQVASLPGRLGGLGLRSAARTAPAAFWSSWVNALPVIQDKAPEVARAILAEFTCNEPTTVPCLREANDCLVQLEAAGATDLPTWPEAADGAEAPHEEEGTDAADFNRGWQCHVSSFSEKHFLERVVKPSSDRSRRVLLLSQASGPASAWLRAVPSEPAYRLSPLRFQVAIRRRLRWPLPLSGGQCCRSCPQMLDPLGDHAAACPIAGRLKLRARPVETTWIRMLRESGARVRENVLLRDTALPHIDPSDGRKIEIVVTGLPIAHGVPVAVDATLVSPLHADGSPFLHCDRRPGASFSRAERSKRETYPELVDSSLLRLLTVASETGGRLNKTGVKLLSDAADARARGEPPVLRRTAARAWRTRWITMISVSVQDALAATLVDHGIGQLDAADGPAPGPVATWLDSRGLV